jgi:hypothetical protein
LAAAFARVQFNYLLRWLVDGNTVVEKQLAAASHRKHVKRRSRRKLKRKKIDV